MVKSQCWVTHHTHMHAMSSLILNSPVCCLCWSVQLLVHKVHIRIRTYSLITQSTYTYSTSLYILYRPSLHYLFCIHWAEVVSFTYCTYTYTCTHLHYTAPVSAWQTRTPHILTYYVTLIKVPHFFMNSGKWVCSWKDIWISRHGDHCGLYVLL